MFRWGFAACKSHSNSAQGFDHRPHSHQVTGACSTEVTACQSWAEYFSRPTMGAEQWWVCWLQCLLTTWSYINFQFQFHTRIAYKPTYMTHDLCHMLLIVIGTDIKCNHTNSAIHSSRHSSSFFTSASDYASAQWRLVLHILVTCTPHFNKCWVVHAIYGIHWGWCHVQARWWSVVSWRTCLTGDEKAMRVSRRIRKFFEWTYTYFDHWLKCMTWLCVI